MLMKLAFLEAIFFYLTQDIQALDSINLRAVGLVL